MNKPIGILGGSFDPVHFGHLRLALECLEGAGLEKIIFIPLKTPPHRGPLVAGPEHRYEMLSTAISSNTHLEISDMEINRDGVSYTIDTLRELRNAHPARPLCLIMGMDALRGFDSWMQWHQIPEYAHIIITGRPGHQDEINSKQLRKFLDAKMAKNTEELNRSAAGKVFRMEIPLLDISSSNIRSLIKLGKSVDYLLPEKVIDYINNKGIYTGNTL